MTATIEPTHLVNQQNGIWLDKQARFRFGKYKNFRVRDVWEADPKYLNWLAGQDWFVEKHPQLVTLDESEPLPPARRAFSVAGNVIRPTAWSR